MCWSGTSPHDCRDEVRLSMTSLEAKVWEWTRPLNGQYPRPWMSAMTILTARSRSSSAGIRRHRSPVISCQTRPLSLTRFSIAMGALTRRSTPRRGAAEQGTQPDSVERGTAHADPRGPRRGRSPGDQCHLLFDSDERRTRRRRACRWRGGRPANLSGTSSRSPAVRAHCAWKRHAARSRRGTGGDPAVPAGAGGRRVQVHRGCTSPMYAGSPLPRARHTFAGAAGLEHVVSLGDESLGDARGASGLIREGRRLASTAELTALLLRSLLAARALITQAGAWVASPPRPEKLGLSEMS